MGETIVALLKSRSVSERLHVLFYDQYDRSRVLQHISGLKC